MLLNYTKQEKSKLDTLQSQLKPQLDKAFETFSKAEEEYTDAQQGKRILSDGEAENFKRTQEEYARLLEEYENKRTSIKRKAEAREARYFALHTDELTERLQFEIEAQIVSFGMLQNHEDFRSVYQNDDEIRDRLTSTYGRYLDILEKHDAENYQLIIDFIESSIADKDEITQAYRAKIEELPTESSKATKSSKAQSAKSMEKAVAIRATDFLAPVDKLSQTLFDNSKNPAFYEKQVLLNVGSKGKKTVHALVSINIDKLQGVTVSNDVMVNPYNRSIHNAVVSLYVAGNTHFTPRMIYQAMNGGTREHKPPEQTNEAIMTSIRKLMYTSVSIDATEEAEAFGFEKLKIEGYTLLPVILTTAEINGQVVECFKFMYEPPLYTYASRKKQITKCDIKLLAVNLNMTPENIVIRDYLLERITAMQSAKKRAKKDKGSKLQNVILYDTLCKYLGITAPTEETLRAKKRDVRNKVRTVLDAWVKAGFIKGYEEERERSSIAKVHILLAENTQTDSK